MKSEKNWISLDERWPEEGQQVKLKLKDGDVCWAVRGSKPCSHCWFDTFFGGELIISPTHWRELSEEEKVDTSIKIDIHDLLFNEFKEKENGN